MKSISISLRAFVFGVVGVLLLAGGASAAEVRVMISGGLTAAYKELVPEFERATGNKVITAYGPSMGTTVNAIPVRLERGEPADVLIMVGYALGDLAKQGKVVADSRVDLVKSPIGIAVKSGTPKPDISSVDALKRALLAAKTVAYSDSASGVYISTEMFQKLGIADEMKDKARKIPATPVGYVRNRRPWRRGTGFPADQRTQTRSRYRHRRAIAAGASEDHGVFRRHRQRVEGAGSGQGADKISRLARCGACDPQERHGADRHVLDGWGEVNGTPSLRSNLLSVMRGLDPRIHQSSKESFEEDGLPGQARQ
jgi:ABC-type molybdate transport system substrate-binding protein